MPLDEAYKILNLEPKTSSEELQAVCLLVNEGWFLPYVEL